jgi:hypothetical protein
LSAIAGPFTEAQRYVVPGATGSRAAEQISFSGDQQANAEGQSVDEAPTIMGTSPAHPSSHFATRATMFTMPNSTPVTAWRALKAGDERFVAGTPQHPSQGIEHRASLAAAQTPNAVVFGCADSRVAAEMPGCGELTAAKIVGEVAVVTCAASIRR